MTRSKHPNRRPSSGFSFNYGKREYNCTYSAYNHGVVFEVFMQAGKPGSDLEAMARDAAVVMSLALQYGCPLSTIKQALTEGELGEPAGPLGVMTNMISFDLEKIDD